MQITQITPENVHDFPVGSVVISRYGAYYPEIEGVVIGHQINPATNLFPVSASLVIQQEQNGTIVRELVTQLYETDQTGPIGTYLVDRAENPQQTSTSPWAA
jgi:hypothetical protein